MMVMDPRRRLGDEEGSTDIYGFVSIFTAALLFSTLCFLVFQTIRRKGRKVFFAPNPESAVAVAPQEQEPWQRQIP